MRITHGPAKAYFTPTDPPPNFDRILEGLCPDHDTPLERGETHGWCPECGVGWARSGDTTSMVLTVQMPDVFTVDETP